MKLLATFHHGRTFGYCTGAHEGQTKSPTRCGETWDVFDPQYADFYWNEQTGSVEGFCGPVEGQDHRGRRQLPSGLDLVRRPADLDAQRPSAGILCAGRLRPLLQSCGANGQEVTICNKHGGDFNFPESFGLRCYENGRDMPTDVGPWFLIDRAIAYPWSYVNDKKYRDGADYHVRSLVDLVSRGGIFLLSLTPKGDGSIPAGRTGDHARDRPLAEGQRRSHLRNAALEDLRRGADRHARYEAEQQGRREGTMGLAEGVHGGRHPLHDQGRYALRHRPGLAGGRQADGAITRQGGRPECRFGELARARRAAHLESVGRWARGDSSGRTTMRLRFLFEDYAKMIWKTMKQITVLLFALANLLSIARPTDADDARPNILFIIVDDQSPYDLKIYNPQSTLETPNIDRLAAEGMVFDGAYHMGAWTGGVCTPSRHMVMSGRTVWHIPNKPGRMNNPHITNPKLVPPDLAQYTMPAVFNRAGLRYDANLQTGQQLRGGQRTVHGSPRRHEDAAARTKRAAPGTPSGSWSTWPNAKRPRTPIPS